MSAQPESGADGSTLPPQSGGLQALATAASQARSESAKRLLRHALLFALCLCVTLAVRATLKDNYTEERRRIELEGRARRVAELAAVWNKLAFTDISSSDFTERFLNSVDWLALQLSADQEMRLRERLPEVMDYLGRPTLDAYLRLKTSGLRTRFELSPRARQTLGLSSNTVAADLSLSADQIAARLWLTVSTNATERESLSRLTAVCLDRVRVATNHTNSPVLVFAGPTAQGFTIAHAALDPGFRYGPLAAAENWADNGPFALVSFFARSNTSSNAGPVYLGFYWSDADQQWAPHRLFTDMLVNFNPLF